MPIDYKKIAEENIKKYGTDIDRYGPVLLANLYSDRTHFVYELLQNVEDACNRARKAGVRNEFYVSFNLFPGRLEMRHDGIIFNEEDVRGICGLVEGTKEKDFTQIGTFGIGFKSVYAYTNTPEIYSGYEAFCIENYVRPHGIERSGIKDNETLFVFPFNHSEVSPEQAFKDISKRFRELGSRTLLFLNNIDEINWTIVGEESGAYIRDPKSLGKRSKKTYIISKVGDEEEKGEEWLIFERPVNPENTDISNLKVEVAFKIGRKIKGKKETIIPADNSYLVVFFPTEKETHLKFLIQGPYRTTPARDNIPKGDESNKELIKETAALVADSVPIIKEKGLLTVDFLNVLPLSSDDLPEDHMFRPIYDAVLAKLKSNEKLLPANDGSYISAEQAFLARGRDLIDLLGTNQLSLLFGKQDAHWLDSNITENSPLWEYFTKELEIPVVRPETFSNLLNEEFMKSQSDEWVIKFYEFLLKHQDLWEQPSSVLRKKPFIRLQDDTHVIPFHANGNPLAYLPTDSTSDFPTVKQSIDDDQKAHEFLTKFLYKPDILSEVIDFLPKYNDPEIDVPKEDNINHIKKIAKALQPESLVKSQDELLPKLKTLLRKTGLENLFNVLSRQDIPTTKLIQILKPVIFREIPFLMSRSEQAKKLEYKKPSEIYLPAVYTNDPNLEIFFEGNPDIWFLDVSYNNVPEMKIIIEKLNISDKPRIITEEFATYKKYTQGFTKDYKMDGLEFVLKNHTSNKNISQYLWNLLILSKKGEPYKIEFQGTLESSNNKTFPVKSTKKENKVTTLLNLLTQNQWLPDKNSVFHKPCKILLSELPDDFEKDSLEAKSLEGKLRFKKDIEQEYLSQVSESERKKIEFAKTLSEDEIELIEEKRKREREDIEKISNDEINYGHELEQSFNRQQMKENEGGYIPPDPIIDTNGRRERTQEEIQESIKNELPQWQRFKRVPAKKWEQKNNEVRTFLKEQYGGKCQICGYTFTKRDGEPYFEGVYLVSRTKASWIDHPGNVLCLCANCCAKFEHGEVEAHDIMGQINKLKCINEGGTADSIIKLKLCKEDVELKISERHMVDLQELLHVSKNK